MVNPWRGFLFGFEGFGGGVSGLFGRVRPCVGGGREVGPCVSYLQKCAEMKYTW